jgi:putative heme-binding domain-containing protein
LAADHPLQPDDDGITAGDYETLPGFKLEIVFKADPLVDGSFISLAKDTQGRLLLGAQRREPMTRITLDSLGRVQKKETLKLPVSEVMGALCVDDALYVDAAGRDTADAISPESKPSEARGEVFGLWRLRDPKGDGSFQSVELLRRWVNGFGDHGSHAIQLGPDRKLYVINGNFTGVPEDLAPTSPHKNYQDDLVLPRAEETSGYGAGKKPPGGYICRMDLDGKSPELFAAGQRNAYGFSFNPDGEIFGFDSDKEADYGLPWYRPIRVFHATSGGDGGFRDASGKWPEYYPDSLPAVVDIGIGCPTQTTFGQGAKFPSTYQKAYFITDWTFGRLIALHLRPKGASYESTGWENLVAPKGLHGDGPKRPLDVTGVIIGNDGALYFTVGGRNTQGCLFRVSYVGKESTAPVDLHDSDGSEARALRHQLEAFHGHVDPAAVDVAWPQLNSADRFIRYAARIAVEAQPLEHWKARALAETRPDAMLTALLAVARLGGAESQPELYKSLARQPIAGLSMEQKLDKLRVIEVSIARWGRPSAELIRPLVAELGPVFPSNSIELNRELSQVLLALDAPDAVAKTVKLLTVASTQEEQVSYVFALRTIKNGWTPELRRSYFSWWLRDRKTNPPRHPDDVLRWFEEAGRPYSDGANYRNYIAHFHDDAKANVPATELASLSDVIDAFVPEPPASKRTVKDRKLVKKWTMADLEPSLADVGHGRSFKRGRDVFEEAQCIACHKFGDDGGAVGPDLTAVGSRFQRRDILESIILPSKVISEQYMNTEVRTKDGEMTSGRLLQEPADTLVLQANPLRPETVQVKKAELVLRRLSRLSPMPEGLVDNFSKSEVLDLLAYLESGGRKEHPDFAPIGKQHGIP